MPNPLFPDNHLIIERDMTRLAAHVARETEAEYDVDEAFEAYLEAISYSGEVAQ